MNVKLLRNLARFVLPVAILFASCGEDDDTSWKDKLAVIEDRIEANESVLSGINKSIEDGEYVQSVIFNDKGELEITTSKGDKSTYELPENATNVSVVPTVVDGKLQISTTIGAGEPTVTEIELPAQSAFPEIKLEAAEDGKVKFTVGDVTEEVAIQFPATASDFDIVTGTDGKVYLEYMVGTEKSSLEIPMPETVSVPVITLGFDPETQELVIKADGETVANGAVNLSSLVDPVSPYCVVAKDGLNWTVTTKDENGELVTATLPAVAISLTGIELVPAYTDKLGTPIQTTLNSYIYYIPYTYENRTYPTEGEGREILGAKQKTQYRINPYGIALKESDLLPNADYIVSDKLCILSEAGTSDLGAALEVVDLDYDQSSSILTVTHQFDHNTPETYNDWYDLFWWDVENIVGENIFNAALTLPNPYQSKSIDGKEVKDTIASADHGLLKQPFVVPMIVSAKDSHDSNYPMLEWDENKTFEENLQDFFDKVDEWKESEYGSLGYQNRPQDEDEYDQYPYDWTGLEGLPSEEVQLTKNKISNFDPSEISETEQDRDWDVFMDNVDYVIASGTEINLNDYVKALAINPRSFTLVDFKDHLGLVLGDDYDFEFTLLNPDGSEVKKEGDYSEVEYFTMTGDVLAAPSKVLSAFNKAFIRVKLYDIEDKDQTGKVERTLMDYLDVTFLAFPEPEPYDVELGYDGSDFSMLKFCPKENDVRVVEGIDNNTHVMHTVRNEVNFDPVYTSLTDQIGVDINAETFFEDYAEVYNNTVVEFQGAKLTRTAGGEATEGSGTPQAVVYEGLYDGSYVIVTINKAKASDNTCTYQSVTVEVEETMPSSHKIDVNPFTYYDGVYDVNFRFVNRTTYDIVNLNVPVEFYRDYTAEAPRRSIFWTDDYGSTMARFNGKLDYSGTMGEKEFVFQNRPVDGYMTGGATRGENESFPEWLALYQGKYSCLEYAVEFTSLVNGSSIVSIPFYDETVEGMDNIIAIDEIEALYGVDQTYFYPYVATGRYSLTPEFETYFFDFTVTDPESEEYYHWENVEYFFMDPLGDIKVNRNQAYIMEEDDVLTHHSLAGLVSIDDREGHAVVKYDIASPFDYIDETWSQFFLPDGVDEDNVYTGANRIVSYTFSDDQSDDAKALIAPQAGREYGALFFGGEFDVTGDEVVDATVADLCYDPTVYGIDNDVTVNINVTIKHRWSETWGDIVLPLTVIIKANE